MANNSMVRGFVPVSENGQNIPTVSRPKSTSSADALYMYSPIAVSANEVLSVVDDDDGVSMTGVVVLLKDSTGAQVETLAADAAGTCVITYQPDQRYIAVVESTNYAEADNGVQEYQVTTELGTSAPYSSCMIGADSSTGPIIASGLVKRPDNAAGVAKCEVYCKINSANYVGV